MSLRQNYLTGVGVANVFSVYRNLKVLDLAYNNLTCALPIITKPRAEVIDCLFLHGNQNMYINKTMFAIYLQNMNGISTFTPDVRNESILADLNSIGHRKMTCGYWSGAEETGWDPIRSILCFGSKFDKCATRNSNSNA